MDRIFTGDDKWILYNNAKRRRSWSNRGERSVQQPRAELYPKIMLNLWWGIDGIFHCALFDDNQTITAILHCDKLRRLTLL